MEAVGHLRSASERGPLREFGKLVFFFLKRAVYKRSVGRGQGDGGIHGQSGVKGKNCARSTRAQYRGVDLEIFKINISRN